MARNFDFGTILDGNIDELEARYERFNSLAIDQDWSDQEPGDRIVKARTIAKPVSVSAPGTFSKKEIRTLNLEPSDKPGWWFDRTDLPDSQPIKCSARNVWTTGEMVSNIVLRSGSSHNYARLVEHIIALKAGMDVDDLVIKMNSGDPPLFEEGSKELVEALHSAGRVEKEREIKYFTVKETVSLVTPSGGFTTIEPAKDGDLSLRIDCARDFSNAIGQQRIKFVLNEAAFQRGSLARTNTTSKQKLFIQTFGKLFADTRNLGYNSKNVLIAGNRKYSNEPKLIHEGKSLEAAWHRAILDLLAALALVEEGRIVGTITDYKGGHYPDVELVKLLYANDLLVEV
ncbi:UDP-3-O-acyl-N-acetylglucosamine deacetylase [Puniceicoccaceae bacterium K14]|nr:UDP-3-O-acyl-N-acetylglucosamine deacetylase [Puniceicoccaceae bacterium K14]